jgi:hypothetical protein
MKKTTKTGYIINDRHNVHYFDTYHKAEIFCGENSIHCEDIEEIQTAVIVVNLWEDFDSYDALLDLPCIFVNTCDKDGNNTVIVPLDDFEEFFEEN